MKGMIWLLLVPVALVAGMAVPTQFAINTQLRQLVGGTVVAAALSFLVGTVILFAAAVVVNRSVPEIGSMISAPPWMYLGGLLGAFYICASIVLTPRLGVATTIGLILTGQVIASMAIDHFGLFGVSVQPASIPRLMGAILVIVGVAIVQRF
jgi:bacterial/archaeal transporter family-2 protein